MGVASLSRYLMGVVTYQGRCHSPIFSFSAHLPNTNSARQRCIADENYDKIQGKLGSSEVSWGKFMCSRLAGQLTSGTNFMFCSYEPAC